MQKLLIALMFIFILSGSAFSSTPESDREDERVIMRQFTINTKEEFSMELAANPSTGYTWYDYEKLPEGIVLLSKNFLQPKSNEFLAGAAGTEIITYRAEKKGKYFFFLCYGREWEDKSNCHSYALCSVEVK